MVYKYTTNGTCSSEINFELEKENDKHIIKNVRFTRGCNGNLQGIGRLADNMDAKEIAEKLRGILCGSKKTSCPDQLAAAIDLAIADIDALESGAAEGESEESNV